MRPDGPGALGAGVWTKKEGRGKEQVEPRPGWPLRVGRERTTTREYSALPQDDAKKEGPG